MLVGRRTVTVEWGDCDPAGIVYFPRYFEWFDGSLFALFETAGLAKAEMLARYQIFGTPLVKASARFITPSTFGDRVVIETRITEWRRSSFDVHHQLFRGAALAVEGFETRVWTAREADGRLKSRPVPAEVVALFSGEKERA
jgi:4-hydroxybenzoyl-CoA thioesterase